MQGMANAAQKHNKVFVSVDTPDEFDPNKANDYATWWENADGNGDYFRSFAQEFIADSDIDESQVWLMGYSGAPNSSPMSLMPISREPGVPVAVHHGWRWRWKERAHGDSGTAEH